LREVNGAPSQQQSQDVAKVVSGIGQQRQRMRRNPEDYLNSYETKIEGCPDGESSAEIRRHVCVSMTPMEVMLLFVSARIDVLVDAHDARGPSFQPQSQFYDRISLSVLEVRGVFQPFTTSKTTLHA
jgi:hypothetical protein